MAEGDKIVLGPGKKRFFISDEESRTILQTRDVVEDIRKALEDTQPTVSLVEKDFEDLRDILTEIREDAEDFTDDLDSISRQLRDNLEYLKGSNAIFNEISSISRRLLNQSEKLKEVRQSGTILTDRSFKTEKARLDLDRLKLENLRHQLNLGRTSLEQASRNADRAAELVRRRKEELKNAESDEKAIARVKLDAAKASLREEKSKLTVLEDINKARLLENNLVQEMNESVEAQARARGFTGNVTLKTRILNQVGLSELSDQLQHAADEATSKVKSAYAAAKPSRKRTAKGREKVWVEATAEGEEMYNKLKPKFTDLAKTLKNAAISWLLTNAIKLVTQLDEIASNLKQRIGTWEIATAAVNSQLITATEYLKFATELTDTWAINPITVFSESEIGKMAEATKLLGLSSEQAQNLGIYAKLAGQDADRFEDSVNRGFQTYNRTNRTAVAFGNVQREVLKTSDAIRLSLGGNGEALAKAANAALELGMIMKDVEGIMNNLINFESSIESEMTAQLLTGNQLNLAKARELSLNNDIAGVANEIKKQGIDAAWWGRANRIQQENMAKALGMSRDQMARMLVVQGLQSKASAAQLATNMNITEEEVKSISMAETWRSTINKLGEAFVPILTALRPIIDLLALAAKFVSPIIAWVSSLGGLLDRTHETTSKWYHRVLGISFVIPVLGRGFVGIFNGITGIVKGLGTASSMASTLLGTFLKIGDGKVLKGVGRTISTSASRAFRAGQAEAGTATEMLTGTTAARKVGTATKAVRGSRLISLGKNLSGFFRSVAKIPMVAIGKVALITAVLTGAAVGIGYALKLMTPALEAIGNLINKTLAGIGTIIVSVGTAISSVIESIATLSQSLTLGSVAAIAALGGAFISLAAGLTALAIPLRIFPVSRFKDTLEAVKGVGQPAKVTVATGQIAEAEVRASTARSTIQESQRAEAKQTAVDLSRVETMLGQLLGAVKEGKNIYLNGDKVGQTLAWSTTSM